VAIQRRNTGGHVEYELTAEADLATIVGPKRGELALALTEGTLWYHNGSSWVEISGGGGGGDVGTDTIFDAKGDLVVGTGSNTSARLAVGTNDYVLTAASGEATGTKWAILPDPPSTDAHDASAISILDTASDFTATDVEGALAELQSDNEAHVAAADPHTGYVKESTAQLFSVGGLLVGAPPTNGVYMVWRAPFACTVTNVRSHITAGTNAVINAQVNQTSDFLSSDYTNNTANAWQDGGSVQNTSISAGDDIGIELVSTSGAVVKVNIQVDLTRVLA
jgi:hypothetical protein